jgi:hypothetical protein
MRAARESQAAELSLKDVVDCADWVAPAQVPGLMNTTTLIIFLGVLSKFLVTG